MPGVLLGTTPGEYERLGLGTTIEQFEDGIRTDPSLRGHYEWWYFDAHLDNGAKLVVVFYTKSFATPNTGLQPLISIDLDLPDGRSLHKFGVYDPTDFSALTEGCDVRIAGHRFTGDLHEYTITADVDGIAVDVSLTGRTEPWRPGTGHIHFGDRSRFFAWLPSVPHGAVTATYRVDDDEPVSTTGSGYHDHNWGNVSPLSVINNWYWGRGRVGPYTFITSYIVSEKEYGYEPVTLFMLARDGKVVADDARLVEFARSGLATDEDTGKPVADRLSYAYRSGDKQFALTYRREETILRSHFIDALTGVRKLAARLLRFDGSYLRFTGTVSLDAGSGDAAEHLEGPALWELMYFGRHGHETRG